MDVEIGEQNVPVEKQTLCEFVFLSMWTQGMFYRQRHCV